MVTELYSIFDRATLVHNKPFHQHSEKEAIRTCTQIVNDPSQQPSHNPEDYILFFVGTYDDSNAEIVSVPPRKICGLHELVKTSSEV